MAQQVNPVMYNTIDGRPEKGSTKDSWNNELMRPVRTGSKARAKLPPFKKKMLSTGNAGKARLGNPQLNAIALYQKHAPPIPAPPLQLSAIKKGNRHRTRSSTRKKDLSPLQRKQADNEKRALEKASTNNRSRVVGSKGVTTGSTLQQEPNNPNMVINLEINE